MGVDIDRDRFSEAEFARFAARLDESLAALRDVLARPGFGTGPATIGAELELCLVDGDRLALPRNDAVVNAVAHPRLTLETDRFNLECNTEPVALAGRPFSARTISLLPRSRGARATVRCRTASGGSARRVRHRHRRTRAARRHV